MSHSLELLAKLVEQLNATPKRQVNPACTRHQATAPLPRLWSPASSPSKKVKSRQWLMLPCPECSEPLRTQTAPGQQLLQCPRCDASITYQSPSLAVSEALEPSKTEFSVSKKDIREKQRAHRFIDDHQIMEKFVPLMDAIRPGDDDDDDWGGKEAGPMPVRDPLRAYKSRSRPQISVRSIVGVSIVLMAALSIGFSVLKLGIGSKERPLMTLPTLEGDTYQSTMVKTLSNDSLPIAAWFSGTLPDRGKVAEPVNVSRRSPQLERQINDAKRTLHEFLIADGWDRKANFVIKTRGCLGRMRTYYQDAKNIERDAALGQERFTFTEGLIAPRDVNRGILALHGDNPEDPFIVFFRDGKLDWDSFCQVRDRSFRSFLEQPDRASQDFRVILSLAESDRPSFKGHFMVEVSDLVPGNTFHVKLAAQSTLARTLMQRLHNTDPTTATITIGWDQQPSGRFAPGIEKLICWEMQGVGSGFLSNLDS